MGRAYKLEKYRKEIQLQVLRFKSICFAFFFHCLLKCDSQWWRHLYLGITVLAHQYSIFFISFSPWTLCINVCLYLSLEYIFNTQKVAIKSICKNIKKNTKRRNWILSRGLILCNSTKVHIIFCFSLTHFSCSSSLFVIYSLLQIKSCATLRCAGINSCIVRFH